MRKEGVIFKIPNLMTFYSLMPFTLSHICILFFTHGILKLQINSPLEIYN